GGAVLLRRLPPLVEREAYLALDGMGGAAHAMSLRVVRRGAHRRRGAQEPGADLVLVRFHGGGPLRQPRLLGVARRVALLGARDDRTHVVGDAGGLRGGAVLAGLVVGIGAARAFQAPCPQLVDLVGREHLTLAGLVE